MIQHFSRANYLAFDERNADTSTDILASVVVTVVVVVVVAERL